MSYEWGVILATGGLLVAIILFGRWLYVRSLHLRSRLQMSYLFTNITHELFTPLTILAASVERLRAESPTAREEYDLMDQNIERLVRLLQQILETSRADGSNLKLHVTNGDVMRYITETARIIEPLMSSKHLVFTTRCQPESMMGWLDTDKLDKIIFNLLSNAVTYTPQGGTISLEVTTNKRYDHIIIRVKDNGIGMTEEEQKRLFSRFYEGGYHRPGQGSRGFTDDGQGFGPSIGLSLTRDLVFLHGGNIECQSTKGVGTTFIVDLPISKEAFSPSQIDEHSQVQFDMPQGAILGLPDGKATRPEEELSTETTDENAYRVLIVEDNAELLKLMRQLLHHRYHILTARNGREAIEVVHTKPLDLIVSDVKMPEMDGYELTSLLKQDPDYGHLPIILLSAKTQEHERQEALEKGADDFITKPFRLGDLQLRIDNILANRERILKSFPIQSKAEDMLLHDDLTPLDREFLQRAYDCVHEHIDDSEYDRERFAADMGASASTLYNKLRALTGMNVSSFLRNIRIKTACQLAKEHPDLRVSDIAYRVGYRDPKYFSTSFKKEMGTQPKEYFDYLRGVKTPSPRDIETSAAHSA